MRALYVAVQRRRRQGKTDYGKRKSVIKSRRPILSVRTTNRNTLVQLLRPRLGGDIVHTSSHSLQVRRMGWIGSGRSLPGAYLTGYLAGKRALAKEISEAVPYIGTSGFHPGSRIVAALKGVVDAGVRVPLDPDVLPDAARLQGEHIRQYASSLEPDGIHFSEHRRRGFDLTKYSEAIEQVKSEIDRAFGGNKRE